MAARFSVDDLRDLQVWQKLAWFDPIYLTTDPRITALVAKDRQFTEDDKRRLRDVELELLNRVIPEYRDGIARGQIEVSTSPFYHPILPLLCDTDIYLRTHPASPMPDQRFQYPEDASEQLERAAACHERLFGKRPVGLWPSEGSVSDAMVPLVAKAGFRWMATDEQILANSLGVHFGRDGAGNLDQPERLYAPYRVKAGGADVACMFRDHSLSDLIGFVYSGWNADAAAADFVHRLAEAGRRYRERTGGEEATIPIILDGENAWEYFEGGGRPFLRALYGQLQAHPDLTTVTMAQACERPRHDLAGIFPGSWIDANFYIWIGHADDRRGWDQLAAARRMLDEAAGADPAALAAAREEVLIAEGSDWFWWYGDDHSSDHDREFDDLFRRHLRNAYALVNRPAPDNLFVSNISTAGPVSEVQPPSGRINPVLDGRDSSYFEWLGAGSFVVRRTAGAMHQTDAAPPVVTRVQFGFGAQALYVRLDGPQPMAGQLAAGYEFTLAFLEPPGLKITAKSSADPQRPIMDVMLTNTMTAPIAEALAPSRAVAADDLDFAVPLAALGIAPGAPVSFAVLVSRPTGGGVAAIERHPDASAIETHAPGPNFDAAHWRA